VTVKNRLLALKALSEVKGLTMHEYLTIHESIMEDTKTLGSNEWPLSFWEYLARLRKIAGPLPEQILMSQAVALIVISERGLFWDFSHVITGIKSGGYEYKYTISLRSEDDGSWPHGVLAEQVINNFDAYDPARTRIETQHKASMALKYLGKTR